MEEGEIVKCGCGLEAALKTAGSGRKYYGCPKRATFEQQCDFTRMLPHTPVAQRNAAISAPAPIQRLPPPPPPSTPTAARNLKRPSSTIDGFFPPVTPSQKRTKMIGAVLDGSVTPEALQNKRTRVLSSGRIYHPPLVSAPEISDATELLAPAAVDSMDVEPNSSQEAIMEILEESNARNGPVAGSSRVSAANLGTDDALPVVNGHLDLQQTVVTNTWPPSSPPQASSGRGVIRAGLASPSPSPVQVLKGKQKAQDHDDLHDLTRRQSDMASNVSITPRSATSEGGASNGATPRQFTAASVATLLNELGGLPEYIRRNEKIQEIKDLKIKHLENEVERLKTRQEELEKILQVYETSDGNDTSPSTSQRILS